MTIAVMLDFSGEVLVTRDGIFVYLYHLLNAFLENSNMVIEIWVYSHAQKDAEEYLAELLDKYCGRIVIFCDSLEPSKGKQRKNVLIIKRMLYQTALKIAKIIKANAIGRLLSNRVEICKKKELEKEYDIAEAFNKNSKADCCYVPFVSLPLALKCGKPVVVQVHDLFTFQLADLFSRQSNPPALYSKYNKNIEKILNQYADINARFVSSSAYTVENQILKYIVNAKKENCSVIPFPPLIMQYEKGSKEEQKEFLERYDIDYEYIAFPSQNRPNKNLILLLKALKIVNAGGFRIKLVTTGKMRDVVATDKFMKENKDIVVEIGTLDKKDLYYLYKNSLMVVCPNLIEGMNISGQCLEALAIGGIPVIHAKSLGIERSLETVGLSLETADLNWVDTDDYTLLAEKIIHVRNNREQNVEKQASVIGAYMQNTWEKVTYQYFRLFEEISK